MKQKIVIIGASIAGINVMNTLVNNDFDGSITLIDQSDTLPYNPYKLTKDWMIDAENTSPPLLKKESYYQKNNIDLKLNTKVINVDPNHQTITTHDGQIIHYDKLVIATGSKLNKLDTKADNLLYLKTYNEALKIKKQASTSKHITIIGAGFIGLELAASLQALDKEVHVILRHPLPLEKTIGKKAAEYIFNLHKSKGVNFIINDSIESFDFKDNKITSFTTKNNLKLETDLVIGAIGVKPNTPFNHHDLKTDKGYIVDKYHRTSLPNVYAAGDNTQFPYKNDLIHLEHWESAYYSGINVAKNILTNNDSPYNVSPYFWTDLYDETFEYIGYAPEFENAYFKTTKDPNKFMVAYTDKDNQLLAILFSNNIVKRKSVEAYFKKTKILNPKEFMEANLLLLGD